MKHFTIQVVLELGTRNVQVHSKTCCVISQTSRIFGGLTQASPASFLGNLARKFPVDRPVTLKNVENSARKVGIFITHLNVLVATYSFVTAKLASTDPGNQVNGQWDEALPKMHALTKLKHVIGGLLMILILLKFCGVP